MDRESQKTDNLVHERNGAGRGTPAPFDLMHSKEQGEIKVCAYGVYRKTAFAAVSQRYCKDGAPVISWRCANYPESVIHECVMVVVEAENVTEKRGEEIWDIYSGSA